MGKDIIEKIPKAQASEAKLSKGDRVKPRSSCAARLKRQSTESEKIFPNVFTTDRELLPRTYKELLKVKTTKQATQ